MSFLGLHRNVNVKEVGNQCINACLQVCVGKKNPEFLVTCGSLNLMILCAVPTSALLYTLRSAR